MIYEFILASHTEIEIPFSVLKKNIELALEKINEGIFSSNSLSKLLVISGMEWQKIYLLKALTTYLHQTGISYGKAYAQLTLIKHHKFTELLVKLFSALFDPELYSKKLAKSSRQA